MTQQEADLIYWMRKRNKALTFEIWRMCQWQIDSAFRAMGYRQCPISADDLIFQRVREQFEERAARLAEAA